MKLLVLSDTHTYHGEVTPDLYQMLEQHPDIDMIIHAGDGATSKDKYTNEGELIDFLEWFTSIPVKYKVFTGGNHDSSLEETLVRPERFPEITFLLHEEKIIEGYKFFGSPFSPEFNNWAFNVSRNKIGRYWKHIPEDVDILITHGPPKNILDLHHGKHLGDQALFTLYKKQKINPVYHIFGHMHDEDAHINNGIRVINGWDTRFVNASICNLRHEVVNKPILIKI